MSKGKNETVLRDTAIIRTRVRTQMLELSNGILITDECVKDFNGKRQHAKTGSVIRNGNLRIKRKC